MTWIVGVLIVLFSVCGGYMLAHGELAALWQPYELIIIGGAAVGSFISSNPVKVNQSVAARLPKLLTTSPFTKDHYMEVLALLYELFNKWRREGLVGLEEDVEAPNDSPIFNAYPRILADDRTREFITDYLRIISSGNMSAHELESLMDADIDTGYEEAELTSAAVTRVADSLPGFGIVAAVLGIVITMKSLGGPPEVLGAHVAQALVGTFLGILLAYGVVGPIGVALNHQAREESKYLECVKVSILAMLGGMPPQLAVEFGRKTLYSTERPSFSELDKHVRNRSL
ncbi:MAG: flagellar motor stator protein MotA [Gammaproteobacteria bacterium]|nr:flagellar motor stator protein MotA [Gammaproteobacteria bacterium]